MEELPRYIPLADAARHYRMSRPALTKAVEAGKMRAVRVNGFVAVAEEDVIKTLFVDLDEKLKGVPIRVTEAAEKYGVSHANLSRWADAGYIRIVERRYSYLTLDEADVKRAATIFQQALEKTGSSTRAGWVLKRTMDYLKQ